MKIFVSIGFKESKQLKFDICPLDLDLSNSFSFDRKIYLLNKELGRGSFGIVSLYTELGKTNKIAVKMAVPDFDLAK